MTAETTARLIAELEALSRTRELTDLESWRLQKMLTVQRRYESRARRPGERQRAREQA